MTAFGSNYHAWLATGAGRRRRGGLDDDGTHHGGGFDDIPEAPAAGRARRAEAPDARPRPRGLRRAAQPHTIEGELVAKSTGTVSSFSTGERVFHQKFGYGEVTVVDGNRASIQFDKAGEKRVVDRYVERA